VDRGTPVGNSGGGGLSKSQVRADPWRSGYVLLFPQFGAVSGIAKTAQLKNSLMGRFAIKEFPCSPK